MEKSKEQSSVERVSLNRWWRHGKHKLNTIKGWCHNKLDQDESSSEYISWSLLTFVYFCHDHMLAEYEQNGNDYVMILLSTQFEDQGNSQK